MRFIGPGIGEWLLARLAESVDVDIAVAFFFPDQRTLDALSRVPHLRLTVSNEFDINDAVSFASLYPKAELRYVEPENGRLHSKVFRGTRADGSIWAIVGSANLTRPGLFEHQEACVILDSRESADGPALASIATWAAGIASESEPVDETFLLRAKEIRRHRGRYVLTKRETQSTPPANYWALKTSPGSGTASMWPNFLAEDVIAIGWGDLPIDPRTATLNELAEAIQTAYDDRKREGSAEQGARMVSHFKDMQDGDLVIVCRGYPPPRADDVGEPPDVHLYGFARVEGGFDWDLESTWFQNKRAAALQNVDQPVLRSVFTDGLGLGSLRQTIHKLDRSQFESFVKILAERTGIALQL